MTQKIIYFPLALLLRTISLLPFWLIYRLSDIMFLLVYHLAHYRRRVVMQNISSSFPELSPKEHGKIARQFYRNLTDYFFETIKLHHISDDQMRRRMQFENIELVDQLFNQNRSIACYFAHCFNWEWAPSITLWTKHKPSPTITFSQVYRPLRNKFFNNFFLSLRSRFHSVCYPKATVFRDLFRQQRQGILDICGFMSDQKPSHGDPTHIIKFLNHPTAMITGTEQVARRLNMAVIYMDIEKPKRGHYKITLRHITSHPEKLPEMAITERYAQMLQQTIRRNPAIWLWSHKRWKIPVTFPASNK